MLNAIDAAGPVQDALDSDAGALVNRRQAWTDRQLGDEKNSNLLGETNGFLRCLPRRTCDNTNHQLMEILMANAFSDLIGHVIKKVLDVIQFH